ncbi:MAG: methyltransferase domain-containing protein [Gammaproteobacteria bacterium]|nr:methyltransferase domain-containing protein [Rhodocyclaceae bacterium]MBU3909118.1 methyltransferase domain-containing protein [Gammaproteobacteria bacterium]MBU3988124.1 methyltransferase domain-containing protein [Gammaproteobacteria bacterium]MBU4003329.1 methyltransferase domain-containing protein [Gammaproteobacteria bacterium]MBU4022161.1 methyltransferase domain-containing protein [Gammaproteobacteria bacterium]
MKIDQAAFWSERYAEAGEDYLFGTAPNKFLVAQTQRLLPGWSALAVADGEGRNSVFLAEAGLNVTAVEISPVGLHKAQRLAASRHVEVNFVLADVLQWQAPAAFDVAVAIFVQFVGPSERSVLFDRIRSAVRPGGLLLMQGYTPQQLEYRTGGPSAEENLYTTALLRAEFSSWEILELREHEDEINEGTGHKGRSALIDLVARKPN